MNTHMSTYLNKKYTIEVLNGLNIQLQIDDNPFQLPLHKLFLMAARVNKKRSFLFVSKVLGKHIPVCPDIGLITGRLLAANYLEIVHGKKVPQADALKEQFLQSRLHRPLTPFIPKHIQPIIIGFAETATALGHSFFEAFMEADYFHTTREVIENRQETITFEEEHSHATSHRVYVNEELLANEKEIILVDDELTTGKTALNIIQQLHKKFPRPSYTVVSILDWRSKEWLEQFLKLEKQLNIKIHTVSLIKGEVKIVNEIQPLQINSPEIITGDVEPEISYYLFPSPSPVPAIVKGQQTSYSSITGRFGITAEENQQSQEVIQFYGEKLKRLRKGKKTLVLGTGEFMYIPMKLALYMGENVFYQSTTRSPIYTADKENYGARTGYSFPNPEDLDITHYVYNILENEYDEIFIIFERLVNKAALEGMLTELAKTKVPLIHVISFADEDGGLDGI